MALCWHLCLLLEYGQYLISYSHVSFSLEIHYFKIHQTLKEGRSPQLSMLNPCPTHQVLSSLMRVQVLVWTLYVTSSCVNLPTISFPVPSVKGSCIFSKLWPPFPCPLSQMSLQMLCPFCFENLFFHLSRKDQLTSEVTPKDMIHYQKDPSPLKSWSAVFCRISRGFLINMGAVSCPVQVVFFPNSFLHD